MQNCIQMSSNMARGGNYRGAQMKCKMQNRMLKNNIRTEEEFGDYQAHKEKWGSAYAMMGAQHVEDKVKAVSMPMAEKEAPMQLQNN